MDCGGEGVNSRNENKNKISILSNWAARTDDGNVGKVSKAQYFPDRDGKSGAEKINKIDMQQRLGIYSEIF